jgi:hypothetical protein
VFLPCCGIATMRALWGHVGHDSHGYPTNGRSFQLVLKIFRVIISARFLIYRMHAYAIWSWVN